MSLRHELHEIIFEADTPLGKAFDVVLLIAIVASVAAVMLESVASIRADHGVLLRRIEATARRTASNTQSCPQCAFSDHDDDAIHCKRCGAKL